MFSTNNGSLLSRFTSFDNLLWSMLTTFQLITLDYWENVYNMVAADIPTLVLIITLVNVLLIILIKISK